MQRGENEHLTSDRNEMAHEKIEWATHGTRRQLRSACTVMHTHTHPMDTYMSLCSCILDCSRFILSAQLSVFVSFLSVTAGETSSCVMAYEVD